MRRPRSAAVGHAGIIDLTVVGAVLAAGVIGIAAAQDNPMLGAWTAVDPTTGVQEVLTVTGEHITFGPASPPIPYRLEPDGEALDVYLADGENPARVVFLDDANAQLSVPGGPAIALKRQDPRGTDRARPERESIIDATAAALLAPAYHPQTPSLEGLLADGWQLDEVAGAGNGVTLLMRNGGHHALCVLLPRAPGTGGDAVHCRRLN